MVTARRLVLVADGAGGVRDEVVPPLRFLALPAGRAGAVRDEVVPPLRFLALAAGRREYSSGPERRGMGTAVDRHAIERLSALAANQYGVMSTRQAAQIGITPVMLRHAVRRGWLRPERRGVYAMAGVGPSTYRPAMAAALAAGPQAVISHRSAAGIHNFHGIVAITPELSFPNRCGRRLIGVRVHHLRDLAGDDVEARRGVHLTVPVRTIIDLVSTVGDDLLGRILDEGAISRLWTAEKVLARLERAPGPQSTHRLRGLLALRLGEGMPHSCLEQKVFRALRPYVPPFVVHHVEILDGERIEMDLAWPELKIDGEVDGLLVREGTRSKFERGCRRNNMLADHGWRIVHFTAAMDDRTMLAQIVPLLPVGSTHARGPG